MNLFRCANTLNPLVRWLSGLFALWLVLPEDLYGFLAYVVTVSEVGKGFIPWLKFSGTPLSWMTLTRKTSPSSSLSITAPRLASFWSSGTGFHGMWSILTILLAPAFLWTLDYYGKSSALLRTARPVPPMLGLLFLILCNPIISPPPQPPRDNKNCFKRRASFFDVAPHCRSSFADAYEVGMRPLAYKYQDTIFQREKGDKYFRWV